jgi:hypothetical protein
VSELAELKDFFVASVGAAAALIGLLFVAITLAPEKIFGAHADARKHGLATGAFIALGNIFFVSLAALVPRFSGEIIAVFALVAMWQVARETLGADSWLRGLRYFGLASLPIYALELTLAVRFALKLGTPHGLVYTIFGLYAYALGAAWTLLGADRGSSTV